MLEMSPGRMLQDVHQQVHDWYEKREGDEEGGGDGQEMMIPYRFLRSAIRRDAVGRKIDHEPIDEYPHGKARNRACRVYCRLADDAHDAEEQEDGEWGKVVPRKDEHPGNEERNKHPHAVKQDDVEVVGGGRDVCLAHFEPKNGARLVIRTVIASSIRARMVANNTNLTRQSKGKRRMHARARSRK
jgi:hypothetical protein